MTAWCSNDGRALLDELFGDRQVRCEESFAKAVNKPNAFHKYAGRQVGNSPENSPLDTDLFSALVTSLHHNWAVTSQLDSSDPRKFQLDTAPHVADALTRTWQTAPTSEQIARDIWRWVGTQVEIVNSHGTVVDSLNRRSGKRHVPKRQIAEKTHPDCARAEEAQVKGHISMLQAAGICLPDDLDTSHKT